MQAGNLLLNLVATCIIDDNVIGNREPLRACCLGCHDRFHLVASHTVARHDPLHLQALRAIDNNDPVATLAIGP